MLIDKLLGSSGKIGLEVEPEDLAGQLVGVLQQGTELTDQLFVGPIILVTEKVRQQADGLDLTFHFPCFWARHSQSKARKKRILPQSLGVSSQIKLLYCCYDYFMVQKYMIHPNFATFTLSETCYLLIIHTLSLACHHFFSLHRTQIQPLRPEAHCCYNSPVRWFSKWL